MRYFITGSALGSFARGFVDDPELYAACLSAPGQAHLLADHQQQVDEGAFVLGLDAMIQGLVAVYDRGDRRCPRATSLPSGATLR